MVRWRLNQALNDDPEPIVINYSTDFDKRFCSFFKYQNEVNSFPELFPCQGGDYRDI